MHLGNTRLNIVKWVSFKQDDSAPLKCSCNCNRGDHAIYDLWELSESEKDAISKDAKTIGANWNCPKQTRTYN